MSNNKKFRKLDSAQLTALRHQLREEIRTFINSDNVVKIGIKGLKVRLINSKKYTINFIHQEIKNMKNETDIAIRRKLRQEIQNKLSDPVVVSGGKKGFTTYLRQKEYPYKMIQEELENVEAFQVHRKWNVSHRARGHKRIMSSSKSAFIGIDIAYIPEQWLAPNENTKYLLVCLNFFTRYLYVEILPSREEIHYINVFVWFHSNLSSDTIYNASLKQRYVCRNDVQKTSVF